MTAIGCRTRAIIIKTAPAETRIAATKTPTVIGLKRAMGSESDYTHGRGCGHDPSRPIGATTGRPYRADDPILTPPCHAEA